MDGLSRAAILCLVFIAIYVNAACLQESLKRDSLRIDNPLPADRGSAVPAPGVTANSQASAVILTELTNDNCWIGQALAPGDVCTYPGTSDEFRVDAEGKGHFLFFTATAVINARNANINGRNYDFSTRRQDDGNWVIELIGTSVNVIRVSDLIAPADSSMSSTASVKPSVMQDEGLLAVSLSKDSGTPEPASTPLTSITETTSSLEQVSDSEPPRFSPIETPKSELPSPPESTSTISSGAEAADAASKKEVSTRRQNRYPQIVGNIGDQTVTVGDSTVVDIARVFSDADGDELERYIVILSNTRVASGTADLSAGRLTLTGLQIGSSSVALKACDHSDCSAPGELTFRLTVEPPPNRPPQVVSYIEDQQITMWKTKSVSVQSAFRDFEGDRIVSYEVTLQDDGLAKVTTNAAKGTLRFTGLQVGSTTVSVKACDIETCGDNTSALRFGLEVVAPPNSPPAVIGSIGDQVVSVGEVIQLDTSSYFEDPDGDQIQKYQFSLAENGIADGTIDSSRGILNIKGVAVGATSITVNASDGNPLSETSNLTFNLEVVELSPHIPHVVGAVLDQTVELGDSVRVPIGHAFDAPPRYRVIRYDFLVDDREVVTDSEITRSGVLTLHGSAVGKSWVSARACSHLGCSNFSDLSFVLVVTDSERPVNRRPEVVGGVFGPSLRVGESLTMDVSGAFSDPDGESIVDYKYIIDNPAVAAGSSITNTGVLMLRGSETGTTTIAVVACDDEDECSDPDGMKFTLTVEASVSS